MAQVKIEEDEGTLEQKISSPKHSATLVSFLSLLFASLSFSLDVFVLFVSCLSSCSLYLFLLLLTLGVRHHRLPEHLGKENKSCVSVKRR